jgi:hypothetical protein
MHWFHKFILARNSTCFGQFLCPSAGVHSLYTQQSCMSYRFVESFRAGYHTHLYNKQITDSVQIWVGLAFSGFRVSFRWGEIDYTPRLAKVKNGWNQNSIATYIFKVSQVLHFNADL